METGTGNNIYTLLGDRVVVLLDEMQDHTRTDSGILIPKNELAETDGGKVTTRTSGDKHLPQGTVIAVSSYSNSKFEEMNGFALVPGDRVYVTKTALSQSYYFYPDRTKMIQDFDGHVCVPHILIEAKLTTT